MEADPVIWFQRGFRQFYQQAEGLCTDTHTHTQLHSIANPAEANKRWSISLGNFTKPFAYFLKRAGCPGQRAINIHAKVVSTQGEINQLNTQKTPSTQGGSLLTQPNKIHHSTWQKAWGGDPKHRYKNRKCLSSSGFIYVLYNFVLCFFLLFFVLNHNVTEWRAPNFPKGAGNKTG